MTKTASRIVFDLVLIGLGILFLVQAYQLPAPQVAAHGVTPGFFPKAVLWLFLAAMAWITVQDVRGWLAQPKEPKRPAVTWRRLACLGAVAAELVLYILVMEPWGYLISTSVFLFVTTLTLIWFFNKERAAAGKIAAPKELLKVAGFAVIASGAIYLIFTQLFSILLP